MDPSSLPQLLSILQTLLASPSPLTLGASLTAFSEICPDQLDLLHPYYRHICRLLVDADEWGQVVALDILTRYARTMLEKPDHAGAVNPATVPEKQGAQPKSKKMTEESEDEFAGIDDDLAMLLHYSKALFQSRNPAVVLGTAVMYFHLAPAGHSSIGQGLIVAPLIKLANVAGLDQRTEIATLTWEVIEAMIAERPVSLVSSSLFKTRLRSRSVVIRTSIYRLFPPRLGSKSCQDGQAESNGDTGLV